MSSTAVHVPEPDLAARIRRLEDRAAISERVVTYAVAVDRRDWQLFGDCFTDPVRVDYDGAPVVDLRRDELVALVSGPLDGFTVTQHLSPNHLIEFDEADPDRAVCHSYMYAQHRLDGSAGGDYFLLRGYYVNGMRRTADGWRIEAIANRGTWVDGNENAVAEAAARPR